MINVNTFKPGITFKEQNEIFVVLESQHSQQGRGQANVKAKIKNLRTGSTTIKTWTGGDKVEPAIIEKIEMSFLYNDSISSFFMNQETFDQIEIPKSRIKWELNFLKENSKIIARFHENEVLDIELPINVSLKVIEAPEGVKGNSQNNPTKKIILETGFEIESPIFIKENEEIMVSTETGKYVGRS